MIRSGGLAVVVIVAFLSAQSLLPLRPDDLHAVNAFLSIVSVIYSVLLAFCAFVVWSQFNAVQAQTRQEADALEDIARMSELLSDGPSVQQIRRKLNAYVESVLGSEWRQLTKGAHDAFTQQRFSELCQALRTVPVVDARDQVVFGQILEAVNRLTRVREERVTMSLTRIPPTLWAALLFLSGALLVSFCLLPFHSLFTGALLAGLLGGGVGLLLGIVKDIDNPFQGIWNASPQPFQDLLEQLR